MAAHDYDLPTGIRGYARHEVDRILLNLTASVDGLQAERSRLADELATIRDELEVTRRQLAKSQKRKPNFAGLGSKFEEVLRVAEAQAEKMLVDARADAETTTTESLAEAARRIRHSEDNAERIVNEALARAEEVRLSSETTAAELSSLSSRRLAEASEIVASAKREAARLRTEGESEILRLRLAAQEQIDSQRLEATRILEEAEGARLAAEREITLRQEAAEIAHAQRHEDMLRTAQTVLDESNAKAMEINRRAHEVAHESETLHLKVQAHVEEQERTSRAQATELLESARRHADETMARVEEFSEHILARATIKLEQMRGEAEYVQEFVQRHRTTKTTDSIIAELEEQLRAG